MKYVERSVTIILRELELTPEEYNAWAYLTEQYTLLDKHQHCFYCGISTKTKDSRTKDHVFPKHCRPRCGSERIRLTVNCCKPCNLKKGNLLPDGYRAKLYASKPIEFYGEHLVRVSRH